MMHAPRLLRWAISMMLIVIFAYWVSGCSATEIERINFDVNAYPYCSDVEHGLTDITVKGCGDCEDYAFEKCKRLKAQGIKSKMLYRYGATVDHIALLANGQVLDNQYKWPYDYDKDSWDMAVNWNCE
jgi:predicted transglutaminase-like cysteine proteinase